MIESPLNYTGSKFKLLPQFVSLFPKEIDTFVDLFCGGCNVGINIKANKIIFNDSNEHLISLLKTLNKKSEKHTFKVIYEIIEKYSLSDVSSHSYEFYGCNSRDGLGLYNMDKFLKLREDFNNSKTHNAYYDYMFYVLILYCFNNQIRFNSSGEFNLPVGKRDFNRSNKRKLSKFINAIQNIDCTFENKDFRKLNILNNLKSNDFVYVDPPYLIANAPYNENDGWTEKDEIDLYKILNKLNEKHIKFAFSNVLKNKGKENNLLLKWIEEYNFNVYHLVSNYSNSNYHARNKHLATEEVLIVNYLTEDSDGV